ESCEELNCSPLATCDDSGDFAVCQCTEGFAGEDCTDIDECFRPDACSGAASCVNTHGGYYCECPSGTEMVDGICTSIDRCSEAPCSVDASCELEDSEVGYSCSCDEGSFGNGWTCTGTDQCIGDPCGADATCVTIPDAYLCQCPLGSTGTTNCDTTCNTLDFVDPQLEAAVRDSIGKPTGDLTFADIEGSSFLSAVDYGIVDLSGLECWSHLRVLDLFGNDLSGSNAADSL